LLLRFYDAQEGSITFDGIDIRELRLDDLRKNFGIVLQDAFLFSGTIASNIRLGTESITDAQVRSAAQQVNLQAFIESLPAGFDEPVKERGATLSVGQKQLLSFARALAHNPRILVLDEATSSVDPETEHLLREGMRRLIENRTSLVIAHRLSTIQNASKIVVMHKGRVREVGTHQDLLDQRGIYFKTLSASIQGPGYSSSTVCSRDGTIARTFVIDCRRETGQGTRDGVRDKKYGLILLQDPCDR